MEKFLRAHFKRFLKFGVIGGVNTGIDFGVFSLLYGVFDWPVVIAHICGFCVAVVNSYIMNRYWAFSDRAPRHKYTFILFVGVTVLGLGVSSLVLLGAMHYGVNAYIAKLLATAASMLWNFCFYQGIVFQDRALKADAAQDAADAS